MSWTEMRSSLRRRCGRECSDDTPLDLERHRRHWADGSSLSCIWKVKELVIRILCETKTIVLRFTVWIILLVPALVEFFLQSFDRALVRHFAYVLNHRANLWKQKLVNNVSKLNICKTHFWLLRSKVSACEPTRQTENRSHMSPSSLALYWPHEGHRQAQFAMEHTAGKHQWDKTCPETPQSLCVADLDSACWPES